MRGLKLLLDALGIQIDSKQIEVAFANSKDALPQLARAFDELAASQKRMEAKLNILIGDDTNDARRTDSNHPAIAAGTNGHERGN